jgi:hypothetical protein
MEHGEVSMNTAERLTCIVCGKQLATKWIWSQGDDGPLADGMPDATAYCCEKGYMLIPTVFSLAVGEDGTDEPFATHGPCGQAAITAVETSDGSTVMRENLCEKHRASYGDDVDNEWDSPVSATCDYPVPLRIR